MIVLGIDPGLASCGWGIVRRTPSRLQHIAHGCVTSKPDDGTDYERARELVSRLWDEVWQALFPVGDAPTVETLPIAFEGWAAYGLPTGQQAHQVGLVIGCLLAQPGRVECVGRAQDWRVAIGLRRDASKSDVATRVRAVLGMARVPTPEHAADALAVAIVAATRTQIDRAAGAGGATHG